MLKEFDEFVNFCVEHGGTLRNHRKFGEMSRDLRESMRGKMRLLEVGEVIQIGDEWYDNASGQGGGESGWYPIEKLVGLSVVAEGSFVRRPL